MHRKIEPFLTTERLLITPLTVNDADFIFELVNTEEWLQFIGNRNVNSATEAVAYIESILADKHITYWVAKLKETGDSIGVVTFITRGYLEHPDIGFAFLPRFSKNGYAYEATSAVLNEVVQGKKLSHILAITVPENIRSIKLLKKLGLTFEKEIEIETQKLLVYGAPTNRFAF